jgi:hypothetical protein
MSDRSLVRVGALLTVVYVALTFIVVLLAALNEGELIYAIQTTLTGFTAFAIVGSLLVSRRPRNTIGWLFLSFGLASAAYGICVEVVTYGLITAPGSIPSAPIAGWLVFWFLESFVMLLAFSILLFPSGKLPSRRWRPVAVALGFWGLVSWAVPAFGSAAMGPQSDIPNPFFVPALRPVSDALTPFASLIVLTPFPVAVTSLVARYRASSAAERQQLKWILLAAILMVASLGAAGIRWPLSGVANFLSFAALPAAVAIAILRYRLFDIDHLINRTLVYGVTSGLIASLFFAGIVALQPLLRPLTSGTDLAVAASTLVAFALFQPIRRRVQDAVDRRFDRSRYDAARTLDAFSEDLRDEVDLDDLRADLIGAVRRTMSPTHASLWLRERGR